MADVKVDDLPKTGLRNKITKAESPSTRSGKGKVRASGMG